MEVHIQAIGNEMSRANGTKLTRIGNESILEQPSMALLCSGHAPAGILLAIHDLAQSWRRSGPVIMSGFQSTVEEEALTVLLRGPQPVVVWLARGMYKRMPEQLQPALDDGRLLLVSPFNVAVQRASKKSAQQRNRLLCACADTVLIAHAESGSATELLAHALLAAGKRIVTLAHESNQELMRLGVGVYSIQVPPVD